MADAQDATLLTLLNQAYQLHTKLARRPGAESLLRHAERMRELLSDLGYVWEDPLGQAFDETRTDCDATVAGTSTENLRIVEVVKPIVRFQRGPDGARVVQRAVVVVQGQ